MVSCIPYCWDGVLHTVLLGWCPAYRVLHPHCANCWDLFQIDACKHCDHIVAKHTHTFEVRGAWQESSMVCILCGQFKNSVAPFQTQNLLEDTGGLLRPPFRMEGGGRQSNPPVTSRCGSLLLPLYVDVRFTDDAHRVRRPGCRPSISDARGPEEGSRAVLTQN